MVFLEVETAIIDQLKSALAANHPNIHIVPFPNDPAELGRVVNAAQIYVGLKNRSYSAPTKGKIGGRVPPQETTLQYELVLRMQELRSHQVTYPVIEAIEQALIGFQPDIGTNNHLLTTAIYAVEAGFVAMDSGLWIYDMVLAIDAVFTSQLQPSWSKPITN